MLTRQSARNITKNGMTATKLRQIAPTTVLPTRIVRKLLKCELIVAIMTVLNFFQNMSHRLPPKRGCFSCD